MKKRFEIEFDTSVIDLDGDFFTVIIVVDDIDRFELWGPKLGIPVNLTALPSKDQAAIWNLVTQRFSERVSRRFWGNPRAGA